MFLDIGATSPDDTALLSSAIVEINFVASSLNLSLNTVAEALNAKSGSLGISFIN